MGSKNSIYTDNTTCTKWIKLLATNNMQCTNNIPSNHNQEWFYDHNIINSLLRCVNAIHVDDVLTFDEHKSHFFKQTSYILNISKTNSAFNLSLPYQQEEEEVLLLLLHQYCTLPRSHHCNVSTDEDTKTKHKLNFTFSKQKTLIKLAL